jgi:beta-catenin-like protein 1
MNLTRLDEKEDTESQAVHNTLSIFENLVEINPKLTDIVSQKTKIIDWLTKRVTSVEFDDNKL